MVQPCAPPPEGSTAASSSWVTSFGPGGGMLRVCPAGWPVNKESSMRYGLSIAFSSPEEYVPLAQAAEERGFAWVTLADHLIYPKQFSVPYPYTPDGVPRFADSDPFPDPWIAVTAMAAATREIGFYTNVYVLPARNPVQVAKIMATASVFTGRSEERRVGSGGRAR